MRHGFFAWKKGEEEAVGQFRRLGGAKEVGVLCHVEPNLSHTVQHNDQRISGAGTVETPCTKAA